MSKKSLVPLALLVIALLSTFFVFGSSSVVRQNNTDDSASAPSVVPSIFGQGDNDKVNDGGKIEFGVWKLPPTISGADVWFSNPSINERYFIAFTGVGEKRKLGTSIRNAVWTSSDENVAKVSEKGVVETVGKGRAIIRAVSPNSYMFIQEGTSEQYPLDVAQVEVTVGLDEFLAVETENARYGFILPFDKNNNGELELHARTYPSRNKTDLNEVNIRFIPGGARRNELRLVDELMPDEEMETLDEKGKKGFIELKEHLRKDERTVTTITPRSEDDNAYVLMLSQGDIMKRNVENGYRSFGVLVYARDNVSAAAVYDGYSRIDRKLSAIIIHVRHGEEFSFPPSRYFPNENGERLYEKKIEYKMYGESHPDFDKRFKIIKKEDGTKIYKSVENGQKVNENGEAWFLRETPYSQPAIVILHP